MNQEDVIEQLRAEIAQLREQKAQEVAEHHQLRELAEELSRGLQEKTEETAELRAENQRLRESLEELHRQVQQLSARVAKDSHTSHKPPSTDGYGKKTRSLRQPSGKKPGGQEGHPGCTRSFVENPDEVIILRPETCAHCQTSLDEAEAQRYERRQKVDLPEIKAQVIEYQAQDVLCSHCHHVTRGTFPDEMRASIQFGPTIKGIALYLLYGQLLPYARTAELLTDLCGCHISAGTLETIVAEGADQLAEMEETIKQALREAEVIGEDETGIRVKGVLYWLHVARTDLLTHYAVHRKRGKQATDEIGILPAFHGISEHDAYSLYGQYTQCGHGLCNAHNLRDLRGSPMSMRNSNGLKNSQNISLSVMLL